MKKSAWLLIVFSGFFITYLPLSPIYISVVLAFIGIFFSIIKTNKIHFNSIIAWDIIFIIYLCFSQTLGIKIISNAFYNVLFSLLYLILSFEAIHNLSSTQLKKICRTFINLSITLLIAESYWRLTHPLFNRILDNSQDINSSFYPYKFSSIMYQDSNFVGLFIVSLFFLCLYLKKYDKEKLNWQMLILAILCFFTFSRASILTIILFSFLIGVKSSIKNVFILTVFLVLGFVYIFKYIISDGGFLARIYIFNIAWNFFKNTSFHNIFFGVGFGNTFNYLGIGPHNIIVVYLLESGIVGLTLLVLLCYKILKQTKFRTGIIMIPFLFNAMSTMGHAIPYLYCIFAIIYTLEKNRYSTKLNSNNIMTLNYR